MDKGIRGGDIGISADRDEANLFPFHLGVILLMPAPLRIKKGAPAVQVSLHLSSHGPEVSGHAVDNSIGFQNLLVDLRHIILDSAESSFIAFSTIKTTGNFFLTKDNLFNFCPGVFCPGQSLVQKDIAISSNSWTPQDSQYLHVILLLETVPKKLITY